MTTIVTVLIVMTVLSFVVLKVPVVLFILSIALLITLFMSNTKIAAWMQSDMPLTEYIKHKRYSTYSTFDKKQIRTAEHNYVQQFLQQQKEDKYALSKLSKSERKEWKRLMKTLRETPTEKETGDTVISLDEVQRILIPPFVRNRIKAKQLFKQQIEEDSDSFYHYYYNNEGRR